MYGKTQPVAKKPKPSTRSSMKQKQSMEEPKPSTGKLKESVNAQPSTRSSVRKSPGKIEKSVNESKPSTRKSPVKPSSRTSTRQSPRQTVTNDKSQSPTLFNSTYTLITYDNSVTNLIIKKISENVKTNKTQHFYLYHKSPPKTYFVKTPDGTLQDLIQIKNQEIDTEFLKNMLMQMFISILTLHHFGIRKKVFDIQDISYYNTDYDSTNPQYFHYKIFNRDYYIKNDGYRLILSDLNEIENNNYEQTCITKTKEEQEAENNEDGNFEDEYMSIIEYFSNLKEIETIKEMKKNVRYQTIDSLNEEHKFLKEVFSLLYQKPQPHIDKYNDTPYIIHHDRMTFFD